MIREFAFKKGLKILLLLSVILTGTFVFQFYAMAVPTAGDALDGAENQILTPSGYKKISEVKKGDEVVSHNIITGQEEINVIERIDITTPEQYYYWEQDEHGNDTNLVKVPFTFYLINGEYKL